MFDARFSAFPTKFELVMFKIRISDIKIRSSVREMELCYFNIGSIKRNKIFSGTFEILCNFLSISYKGAIEILFYGLEKNDSLLKRNRS